MRRGVRGENTIAPHSAGVAVEYNDRPTLLEFFTNTNWIPAIGEFGVIPLINATLMTSAIAMLVALPLGIGAAIYLSEYASPRVRSSLKPVLEILAGIPTVVYGYFALTFMTPLLRGIFGVDIVNIYNTASAGIVVGILIIPLVSSMSEDALHAVPQALREASYGLGATKLETVIKVVVPAALSGILAAFIVAVSRAIGETMIVAIAAGAGPNFSFNPFDSAETMTGHIARISGGDLSYDSIDYNSIFAIGLTLFLMTFILNVLSRVIISRFREANTNGGSHRHTNRIQFDSCRHTRYTAAAHAKFATRMPKATLMLRGGGRGVGLASRNVKRGTPFRDARPFTFQFQAGVSAPRVDTAGQTSLQRSTWIGVSQKIG